MSPTYNNSMETYSNYISQFEIVDNPPKKKGFHRHHIIPVSEQKRLYGDVIDNRQIYVTKAQHLWCHILYDREHDVETSRFLRREIGVNVEDIKSYDDCLSFNDIFTEQYEKKCSFRHSDEAKERISRNNSRYWKDKSLSEETKAKISKSLSGENHPMFGKHLSEETKKKVADGNRGKVVSEESKRKNREAHLGKKMPESMKKAQADRMKGNQYTLGVEPGNKGMHWYNNGISNKMAYKCPEGYVEGYLRKARRVTN